MAGGGVGVFDGGAALLDGGVETLVSAIIGGNDMES